MHILKTLMLPLLPIPPCTWRRAPWEPLAGRRRESHVAHVSVVWEPGSQRPEGVSATVNSISKERSQIHPHGSRRQCLSATHLPSRPALAGPRHSSRVAQQAEETHQCLPGFKSKIPAQSRHFGGRTWVWALMWFDRRSGNCKVNQNSADPHNMIERIYYKNIVSTMQACGSWKLQNTRGFSGPVLWGFFCSPDFPCLFSLWPQLCDSLQK